MQAVCDTVDQGRGAADKKARRKRRLAQYAEQEKTQRVVAFMELVSSDDDLVESMDDDILKEINQRQRLRMTQWMKSREKTAKTKASESKSKESKEQGAAGGKAKATAAANKKEQQQPAAKKKKRRRRSANMS